MNELHSKQILKAHEYVMSQRWQRCFQCSIITLYTMAIELFKVNNTVYTAKYEFIDQLIIFLCSSN